MMRELTQLWHSLQDPEYLHLLLEPLPVFGLGFGMIFLLAGLLLDQSKTRMLALVVIILSAGSVYWYLKMRVSTEPRVAATISSTFHPLIVEQTARRQNTAWVYYSVAVVGIIALFASAGGKGSMVSGAVLVIVAAAFVHSVWLHKKECEIYHRNIVRYVSPK